MIWDFSCVNFCQAATGSGVHNGEHQVCMQKDPGVIWRKSEAASQSASYCSWPCMIVVE